MKIPIQNTWRQENDGEIFGSLNSSFNLDLFTDRGRLKISPRFMYTTSVNEQTDLLTPVAFKRVSLVSNEKWYIISGSAVTGDAVSVKIYVGGPEPDDVFIPDTATGTPDLSTSSTPDLETFAATNGDLRLYAAAGALDRQDANGADWDTVTSLSSSGGAPLIKFAGRLYYKYDYRSMGSIDDAETAVNPSGTPNTNSFALRLLSGLVITCGRANSSFIWLGTLAEKGQLAKVIKWNGETTNPAASYEIPAQSILAMTIKDDQPWIIDSQGEIWGFNGGTFVKKARLPFQYLKKLISPLGDATLKLVHYNGMITKDNGDILILVNATYADGTSDPLVPSGLWIYNDQNGLYHAGSMSKWKYGTTTTAIDYGYLVIDEVGALGIAESYDSTSDGRIMAGAKIATTMAAVFIDNADNNKQKAGWFTTPWIYSTEVKDNFNKTFSRSKEFGAVGDKFVLKYRTEKVAPALIDATWVSSESFTTVTDISAKEGYEVQVLTGIGAGKTAHITDVYFSDGVYNATVDETFSGATGSATMRLENWTKSSTYDGTDDNWEFNLDSTKTKIQLKMSIIVTGDWYLHDLNLANTSNQPAK